LRATATTTTTAATTALSALSTLSGRRRSGTATPLCSGSRATLLPRRGLNGNDHLHKYEDGKNDCQGNDCIPTISHRKKLLSVDPLHCITVPAKYSGGQLMSSFLSVERPRNTRFRFEVCNPGFLEYSSRARTHD
jgi:hypothetical protein